MNPPGKVAPERLNNEQSLKLIDWTNSHADFLDETSLGLHAVKVSCGIVSLKGPAALLVSHVDKCIWISEHMYFLLRKL